MATNTEVTRTIREDIIVPAKQPWSTRLEPGEILRFVDLEGQQAIDFLCYNGDDPTERYHAANTIKLNKNMFLGKDSVLWFLAGPSDDDHRRRYLRQT